MFVFYNRIVTNIMSSTWNNHQEFDKLFGSFFSLIPMAISSNKVHLESRQAHSPLFLNLTFPALQKVCRQLQGDNFWYRDIYRSWGQIQILAQLGGVDESIALPFCIKVFSLWFYCLPVATTRQYLQIYSTSTSTRFKTKEFIPPTSYLLHYDPSAWPGFTSETHTRVNFIPIFMFFLPKLLNLNIFEACNFD